MTTDPLAQQLTVEYGSGFSEKGLCHMMKFVEAFPDESIVSTLSRQLSWSHSREIIYLYKPLQRDFYAEMCRVEQWSIRTLRKHDGSAFNAWLSSVEGSLLGGFARSLRTDPAAVRAAVELPWSNGQTEGQVNRLKLIKRSMYGRAGFDLLRERVLHAAWM